MLFEVSHRAGASYLCVLWSVILRGSSSYHLLQCAKSMLLLGIIAENERSDDTFVAGITSNSLNRTQTWHKDTFCT